MTGCDQHSTFAFDFEFNEATAFDTQGEAPPRIQMAFSYCRRKPNSGSPQKRLRVDTKLVQVAKSATELYDHVNVDVVMALLTHKIALASAEEGTGEGDYLELPS